jgi:dienelactone hydrolase
LIHHGAADCTVAPGQSQLLRDALVAAGRTVTLRYLAGADHGGPAFSADDVRADVDAFLDRTLR